jgi:hypothetical protein
MQVQTKTSEDIQLDRVTLIERLLCKSLLHAGYLLLLRLIAIQCGPQKRG